MTEMRTVRPDYAPPRYTALTRWGLSSGSTRISTHRCSFAAGRRWKTSRWPTRLMARSMPTVRNAILICHALSGDAHVAGYYTDDPDEKPGWWDDAVGPGKMFDTDAISSFAPT